MLINKLKKVLVCTILICLIFPYFYINITYAYPVDSEGNPIDQTEQLPSEIEEVIDPDDEYTNESDDNLSSDVDDDTGTILSLLLEMLMAVGDAIMSVLSSCMLGTTFEYVMPKWGELDSSDVAEANTTKTFTQEEIDKFKNNKGVVPELRYPEFKYSPEEIFKGEIDLFGIDFIGGKTVKDGEEVENSSEGWNALRGTVASWYKTLRLIAIIGLLSILIYIGIRIILTSSAGKKAEYKKSFVNWVIAVFLVFTMHYIMSFIISVIQNVTTLVSATVGNVKVVFQDKTFVTNFMGLARFEAQQNSLINKLGFVVIYFAFITLTFKFTLIYFKRMISMAFLTISAPLIAMMYPLDKLDGGKSRTFGFWLKEYMFNALLQVVHLLLYNILIGSAVQLAVENPVYAIIALFFLAEAEKLMKKIFEFGRASGGTVGGLAKTVGSLAVMSSISHSLRDIIHPRQNPRLNTASNSKDGSKNDFTNSDDSGYDTDREDEAFEKRFGKLNFSNLSNTSNPLNLDKNIYNIRSNLNDIDLAKAKDETKDFEEAFNELKLNGIQVGTNGGFNNKTKKRLDYMENFIKRNEEPFIKANIPLQYTDSLSHLNSNQILEKMRDSIKAGDMKMAEYYFNILNRRIIENKFFRMHKGPQAFLKRKYSNLTDDELKEMYEEAKNSGNKQDILECEAEMALRNKDYKTYDSKLDEIEEARLGVDQNGVQQDGGSALVSGGGTNSQSSQQSQQSQQKQGNGSQQDGTQSGDDIDQDQDSQDPDKKQQGYQRKPVRTNINYDRAKQRGKIGSLARGLGAVAQSAVSPIWDTDKTGKENLMRAGGNIAKGAVQILGAVTVGAVQAGISATDGKYGPGELGASLATGFAVGGKVYNKGARAVKDMIKDTRYSKKETRKAQIAKDWSERDDVQEKYKQRYGSRSNEMIRRARDRFARQGITDVEEQKKLFRYSNYLRKQHNTYTEESADNMAVQVFKFRNKMNDTYGIPETKQGRKAIIDEMVQQNRSTKTAKEITTYYNGMFKNAQDFETVEDNEQYDYFN